MKIDPMRPLKAAVIVLGALAGWMLLAWWLSTKMAKAVAQLLETLL